MTFGSDVVCGQSFVFTLISVQRMYVRMGSAKKWLNILYNTSGPFDSWLVRAAPHNEAFLCCAPILITLRRTESAGS